ncbi:MAG: hypothetical protein RBU37_24610, partial [Myxococcota bacterium]|nr:hypothetical protein [Myxococcota bacterium]
MRNTAWSLGLVVVAALCVLPSLASAESENVFLLFGGSEKEQKALEAEANYFRSAMLKHADYVFVADQERMVVMAQCREEMGVSLDEERACQLRATKRLMAQRVFELRARQQKGRVELTLTVLNDDGGTIYETIMEYEGDELSTAARRLFPSLALAYLCDSEKLTSACSGSGDA